MATLSQSIRIYDGMSGPLRHITRAMNIVISDFQRLQSVSNNPIDTVGLKVARQELAQATVKLDKMEQSIKQSNQAQQGFNRSLRSGADAAGALWNKVKGVAVAAGGLFGAKQILGLSDQLTGAQARLNLIVDDGGSVAALEQKIMASAQRSRAGYLDTMQSVSKLGLLAGDAFSSNDEMIRFAELMNKNFIIAGASTSEQQNAMYQLNQAMASGRLQGDEYRSIIENAPLLAQSIEDYMRNVQRAQGTLKDWSSQGLLTADVIKNALFSSADEIEERFSQMPMTWSQIWTLMQNKAISVFQPILKRLNEIANSKKFAIVTDGLINGLAGIARIAGWVFELMINIASVIIDNWSWISPIVYGVAAAFLAYQIATKGAATATAILTAAKYLAVPAYALLTGATMASTAAQWGLNAALYACPLVWIMIIIIAIIAVIYAAIAAVNHFAGTSISATGAICGAFMVALAFIGNLFITLYNLVVDVGVMIYNIIADVANFIGNVFNDPIGAVCRLFFGLADTVLHILQSLASAIDTIFGSNLAASVQGWRDSLGGWVDKTFGKGNEIVAKMSADDFKLNRFEYGAAWNMGYSFGEGIDNKISDLFNFKGLDSLLPDWDAMMQNVGDTAANTARTADAMDISNEDLKYIRDLAERDVIDRTTVASITVDMGGVSNTINSPMDLDGVVAYIADYVSEGLAVAVEGVH